MIVKIKGRDVLIDEVHRHILESRSWHISDTGYVVWRGIENGKKKTLRMHRLVIGAKSDQIVDHMNRNKLDNRLSNLRICTQKENIHNSDRYDKRKGYYFDNTRQRWAIDSKELGIKSLYMDSEEACKDYISSLRKGIKPARVFTPRPSLGGRKITDQQIDYIFSEYLSGRTKRAIASELGYSESAIGRIINGVTTMGGTISRRRKNNV